jgi:uncharacterized protein YdiU (UPF0061 family)
MHRYAVTLAALLVTRTAFAEPPKVRSIPEGPDVIQAVKKGEPAPYAGQLFDPPTALRFVNWIEQYRALVRIEEETQRALREAEVNLWRQKFDASEARYKVVVEADQKALAELRAKTDRPFYDSPWFGFALGVGVAAAGGLALVVAAK